MIITSRVDIDIKIILHNRYNPRFIIQILYILAKIKGFFFSLEIS